MQNRPIGIKLQKSWFRRFVVIDYFDGLKEALAECPEGHAAFIKMVAWDAGQDLRVFVVFELESEAFGTIEGLLSDEEKRWPFAFPDWVKNVALDQHVARILDSQEERVPNYFVIAENLGKEVLQSGEIEGGEDWKQYDWQAYLKPI